MLAHHFISNNLLPHAEAEIDWVAAEATVELEKWLQSTILHKKGVNQEWLTPCINGAPGVTRTRGTGIRNP